ncbi:hypothetical protein SGFS_022390 [Streptomyces graminofaciens]|uniref:Xylose transport system permease protein XylH n=1 Tax=Streptomyces graminofaciens TaxID=68212 RepID=A0ABN5VD70_9ACTN|nr:hypothetical protein SGFS_022390 [Streptomyces graminofaciens]
MLLIGEIDLSVGSVSGLAAVVFAVLSVNRGVPEWLAVIAAVLTGAAIGTVQGFFYTRLGVPAFVVTLAGLLSWYGLMLYVLGSSSSVNLDESGLVGQLTNYYLPIQPSRTAWRRSARPPTSSPPTTTTAAAGPPGCRAGRSARSGYARASSR